jgi:hypothetical protein
VSNRNRKAGYLAVNWRYGFASRFGDFSKGLGTNTTLGADGYPYPLAG